MWILEIKRGAREVFRGPVQGNSVLIGRSPACNLVVRFPGIHQVHFLLEWIGEGEAEPGGPDWSLLDIHLVSKTGETEASDDGVGLGTMLGKDPTVVDGFSFAWAFDALAETHLKKGILSRQMRLAIEGEEDPRQAQPSESQVLEVVTMDVSRDSVTDIQHVPLRDYRGTYQPVSVLPQVLMHSPIEKRVQFSLEKVPEARAYLRGSPIRPDDLKETIIGPNDLLQIRWNLTDYYFRLVPEVKTPKLSRQFWHEPFNLWSLGALGILTIVLAILNHVPLQHEIKEPVPPRIAQVYIKEPTTEAPAEPSPPAEQPSVQPTPMIPEPINAKPTDRKNEVVIEKRAESVAPQPEPKVEPNKPAVPAKKDPVTKLGLLANLKKNEDKPPEINADKILNEGIVSDTVGGKTGFIVNQPPSGLVKKSEQNSNDLFEASSNNVKVGQRAETNSLGLVSGAADGGLASVKFGTSEKGEGADSTAGGLDRATVRQILNNYKPEVRNCYEKALLVKAKIEGRMVLQWTISPKGTTETLSLVRSKVDTPTLEKCVADVIKGISWPASANHQPTTVIYPFEFTPTGRGR